MSHLKELYFLKKKPKNNLFKICKSKSRNWLLCRNGVQLCHQKKCLADSLLHNMNIGVVKITCARGRQPIFI